MPFWRAIGFGIFLVILALAMPAVFGGLEETLLALLQALQHVFEQAGSLATPFAPIVPGVSP